MIKAYFDLFQAPFVLLSEALPPKEGCYFVKTKATDKTSGLDVFYFNGDKFFYTTTSGCVSAERYPIAWTAFKSRQLTDFVLAKERLKGAYG